MSDVVIAGDATSALVGVTKRTLDRLLDSDSREANRIQIVALYLFYCYTAKWQRTEQIKCTNSFAAKRLQLSTRTIARARSVLEQMELVRSVSTRSKDGKVEAWYIRVNHIQNATDGTVVGGSQNAKQPECHPCHTNASDTVTGTKCLKTGRRSAKLTDDEFVAELKINPAYAHINFEAELGKMQAWLLAHPRRQLTRAFMVNWLNKEPAPVKLNGSHQKTPTGSSRTANTANARRIGQYADVGKV